MRFGLISSCIRPVSTLRILGGGVSQIVFLQYVSNLANIASRFLISTVRPHACSCHPYLSSNSSASLSIFRTLKYSGHLSDPVAIHFSLFISKITEGL